MLTTPEQIDKFRAITLISAISLYLKCGIIPNRTVTPGNMRKWASGYTGKQYARSKKGMTGALADLRAMFPKE
jgi:hypothetical protein